MRNASRTRRFAYMALAIIVMTLAPTDSRAQEPTRVLFTNVNVFDGVNDGLLLGMSVLVEGNMIAQISPGSIRPGDATVIDGGGRTLMPGLIDSHVHLTHQTIEGGIPAWEAMAWDEMAGEGYRAAREFLMSGFTTVRDMGGSGPGLKRAIDRGVVPGPRVYPAGPYISQTSGHGDLRVMSAPNSQYYGMPQTNLERLGLMRLADGVPEVLLAVREALSTGSVYVKIMTGGGISSSRDPLHTLQYTDEEIQAAVEAASHFDTYVATHVYSAEGIKRLLNNGVMSIDHGQFIDEEGLELLAEKGAFLSTNLAGMTPEIRNHPVYGDASTPTGQKTLQFLEQSANFVELANRYRPKMVFQTDVVLTPTPDNRAARDHSLYLHAEWFGNFEALKAMTSVAGELAALTGLNNPYPGRLGVIEEGAYADIILVDGNPLEDLRVLGAQETLYEEEPRATETVETIPLVMKDGVIYRNTLGM